MQTDNLADMIRNESDVPTETTTRPTTETTPQQPVAAQSETAPVEQPTETAAPEQTTQTEDNSVGIRLTNLSTWFEDNRTNLPNVRRVRMDIAGIDPDKTLLLSVVLPNQTTTEGQEPNRDIFVFKGADTIPVLDYQGMAMFVYNNGFEVHHRMEDDYILKCYGIKTGLIVVHCLVVGDQIIPFAKEKIKRKDPGINRMDHLPFKEKLEEIKESNADQESIQLQYKQITKFLSGITTNQDAIDWLVNRQVGLMDINHLLQLDDVMINILS